MADYLLVTGEDPVNVAGTIDGAGALQIVHGSSSLADYNQTLHAAHEELEEPTGLVMIKIFDFSGGGAAWQMTAVHDSTSWSRGGTYAYFEFGPMTSPVQVDITATSNANPPATKARTVWIKTKPPDGQ